MYILTQHPEIAKRLQDEILDTVGHSRPTFEQMKNMKYLRAFINGLSRFFRLANCLLLTDDDRNSKTLSPRVSMSDLPEFIAYPAVSPFVDHLMCGKSFSYQKMNIYLVVFQLRTPNQATLFSPTKAGEKPFYIPANRRQG